MVSALPQTAHLKLQQTLAQWQHWNKPPASAPSVITPLEGGLSNTSVRVSASGRDWVVRIDGVPPEKLGLNRSAEWRAMQNAFAAGLCPRPVYHNPQIGCLVTEYCETASFDETEIERVAALLRAIHTLPAVKFRLDPLHRAHRYLGIIGQHELPGELLDTCQRLDTMGSEPVLCHNDLLASNRLETSQGLLALDWEYVAVGDPLFDLAVCVEGDSIPAQQLLAAYLQRDPKDEENERLQLQGRIYRELTRLWELAFQKLKDNRDTISA